MGRIVQNDAVSMMVTVGSQLEVNAILRQEFVNVLVTTFMMIALSPNVTKPVVTMEFASMTLKKATNVYVTRVLGLMGGWEKTVNTLFAKMNVIRLLDKEDALHTVVNVPRDFTEPTAPRRSVLFQKVTTSCVVVTGIVLTEPVLVNKVGLERHVILVHVPTTVVNRVFVW